MKTLEERAREYADAEYPKCGLYDSWADDGFDEGYNAAMNSKADRAFIAGAQSEHEEMTRWNDLETPPKYKEEVLLKIKYPDGAIEYRVGWLLENGRFTMAAIEPRAEIIGWRPIHE